MESFNIHSSAPTSSRVWVVWGLNEFEFLRDVARLTGCLRFCKVNYQMQFILVLFNLEIQVIKIFILDLNSHKRDGGGFRFPLILGNGTNRAFEKWGKGFLFLPFDPRK